MGSQIKFGQLMWREDKSHWRARYRHDGRRYEKVFDTEQEARLWLESEASRVLSETWASPIHRRRLFGEVAEEWWMTRSIEPATAARDLSVLEHHVLPRLGSMRLAEIDYHSLTVLVAEMTREGKAPATVSKAYGLTRQILTYAQRRRWIAVLPAPVDNLPKARRKADIEPLTLDDIWQVADTIERRYRALVVLGGYTGARVGELLGLRAQNLNLLHQQMHVVEDLENVQGQIRIGAPLKQDSSIRIVDLPAVVVKELEAHHGEFDEGQAHRLIFSTATGAPIRLDNWRRQYWKPAIEEALGFYMPPNQAFRHSHISWMIAEGASGEDIAARVGSSPRMINQVYGHQFRARNRMWADRLEEMSQGRGTRVLDSPPFSPHNGPKRASRGRGQNALTRGFDVR